MEPEPRESYDASAIETKWQSRWAADHLMDMDLDAVSPDNKFYNLVEFPYPSAEGLHVGHAYTYSGADAYGRYLRMRGRSVFQPIGFDSFGIHTENFALKMDEHPRSLTDRTIENYRRQLRALGAGWDWSREVVTSDPTYYRWTQWIFVKLFKAGLAVRREAPVVWCPSCLTVLANEQLEGEACERCGTRVIERTMLQWFLRITAYADELLEGLEGIDWPQPAVRAQQRWIGRSEGAEIEFAVADSDLVLRVFTTRPDTLFGATFLAIPPEHPDLAALTRETAGEAGVATYVAEALRPRSISGQSPRSSEASRSGVPTGAFARHPVTNELLPIFVADYVVATYGSGAVMGVPAHDERDFTFAEAHRLPVIRVIRSTEHAEEAWLPWTGEGVLVDSGHFTGLPSNRARAEIVAWLQDRDAGQPAVRYRLRDWLISRQRYWGPPIPIVYCEEHGAVAVPEEDLPVLVPDVADFRPTGTGISPLASAESFVHTTCPTCGAPATRETDVSDAFLDSAWYFLRYPSTDSDDRPWDADRTNSLLPVDSYAGGPEHVTRHHLYARFLTRALHDQGLVSFREPFPRLRLHGMLTKDGAKMSKSRGNVVNPDRYIVEHGADVTRMYLLFIGPWEEGGDFSDAGIAGIERFLRRLWRVVIGEHEPGPGGVDLRPLDRTVAVVGADIENMRFNTAIASLMELVRWASQVRPDMSQEELHIATTTIVRLLAPIAPHVAEELWSRIGGDYSVHQRSWPTYDPTRLRTDWVTIAVQVDGKTRDRLELPAGTSQDDALRRALDSDRIQYQLGGTAPIRVMFVPDRLLNLVTR
jgi:leucyl-tRNA synthetase